MLESGEKTLTLDPGTFVKVTAETNETEVEQDEKTEDGSVITIAVSTAGGIELEPVTMGRGSVFTREITVTEIDKVVDITFGSSVPGIARAARVLSAASEEFPETGNKYTGTCTVKSVVGGNGHTVYGVTLGDFTGILSGEGEAEVNCAQHSAAAPVAGMNITIHLQLHRWIKRQGK